MVWFHMCGAPWANDWDNVGSIDFFTTEVFTYGNGMDFKDKIILKCLNGLKYAL